MNKLNSAINQRNGALVRMYYIDNTKRNHYEVWYNNRTFITESKAVANKIYNECLV